MVFVQALANAEGPARTCYELARSGRLVLCVRPEVMTEVGEVLGRPKLRRKLPNLTSDRVQTFLADVTRHASFLSDVPRAFHFERDPKDEPYINLALASGARYLISRDNDLLELMTDESFRRRFPGLSVLDPPALLRELASTTE
jgi:putative PIN family toxin of toxin-antitoxin system